MFGGRSFIIRSAVTAFLALPQGFAVEALAATSPSNTEVTAPSQDPCEQKGYGCQPGITQGQLDGYRCIASNPGGHGDSNLPDFAYGYSIGHQQGWDDAGCSEIGQWTDDDENGDFNGDDDFFGIGTVATTLAAPRQDPSDVGYADGERHGRRDGTEDAMASCRQPEFYRYEYMQEGERYQLSYRLAYAPAYDESFRRVCGSRTIPAD